MEIERYDNLKETRGNWLNFDPLNVDDNDYLYAEIGKYDFHMTSAV